MTKREEFMAVLLDYRCAVDPRECNRLFEHALALYDSMSVEDAIDGVVELFPSADKQAMRCLAELLLKERAEKEKA